MEGPSLVILAEELSPYVNKKVLVVSGNSKQEISRMEGEIINDVKSWGKHLLVLFSNFTLKIHFLLFGSYRINEAKENRDPRLSLQLENGVVNFYSCSVHFLEGPLEKYYDWQIDVMSPKWNEKLVAKKVDDDKDRMVCDVLMDQNLFAGVGNIIKNEVLFNLFLHPEARVGDLSKKKVKALVKEARDYSFRFFEWKKKYELRKHWLIYKKRKCTRCGVPLEIRKTGKGERRSYFCLLCQNKS